MHDPFVSALSDSAARSVRETVSPMPFAPMLSPDEATIQSLFEVQPDGSVFFGLSYDVVIGADPDAALHHLQLPDGSLPAAGDVITVRSGYVLTGDDLALADGGQSVTGAITSIRPVVEEPTDYMPAFTGVTYDSFVLNDPAQPVNFADLADPVTADSTWLDGFNTNLESGHLGKVSSLRHVLPETDDLHSAATTAEVAVTQMGGAGNDHLSVLGGGMADGGAGHDLIMAGGLNLSAAVVTETSVTFQFGPGFSVTYVDGAFQTGGFGTYPFVPDGDYTLLGGKGHDAILYTAGTTRAHGDGGNDVILGIDVGGDTQMRARLAGGAGNDTILAAGDVVRVNGGKGDDIIGILADRAVVKGGAGADTFLLAGENLSQIVIKDFGASEDQILDIHTGEDLSATLLAGAAQVGSDVVITGAQELRLSDVSLSDLWDVWG